MINDDKTGWSAGPRVAVGTPWSDYCCPSFLFFSSSLPLLHLKVCFFLLLFFHYSCFSTHVPCSRWHVCHKHTAWTDGAAWSVWQITLLVVRLHSDAHCCSPFNTTNCPLRPLKCAHTCQHTQAEVRLWAKYWASSPRVPCVSYLYPRISVWPPKTSKCIFKTKASKYKVLRMSCRTRDLF